MNSSLRDDVFDDQYSMSLCEGLFRGVGMLQQVDDQRKENEGLKNDLKTSQSLAAELCCQLVEAERKLQEEKGVSLGKGDGGVGGRERGVGRGIETSEGSRFRFSGAAKHYVYRAYRDVGYQSGLKDGYIYSAQGLGRKETPLHDSKAKKRLSKLDKEFGGKTPALLEKILEHPMISIDELKVLLTPAGPSSPKSLSGGGSQCSYPEPVGDPWLFVACL
ncbi:hypothetical protein HanRHA438_Chr09g0380161 [Helianthus annuus]|uniref:Uncharacterized protein n=1 Tax=Helianthus annuus TaxID=4232 RepID=A0A9K3N6L2_HELAN|nr:hypothetical protein HanXRQr2_Chr09g0368711 [Helianthus annuus]KAJ0532504.1 hypothetical protein HanIR_Chr09g0397621 [Helianthus annuus]KAJ0540975.1 hypothetical protein HanHA89_Chr09g0323161 [Helianthus annuus]KAJ0710186.1 hypothetical protein HanOQP8_Chr09g0309441 [Helianthus annuus]KAJ0886501.1 hypothetical protein HanRHA438_Chr09g0380161 [Helianthus annuus]